MSTETTTVQQKSKDSLWRGGTIPMGASYGKMMMWFFLISDTFSFASLLVAYGYFRIISINWPIPNEIFVDVPFIAGDGFPLVFVTFMTFVLIASSVTMVLAVEAGHRNSKAEAAKYVLYTIAGGITFLACQAWEWTHLITHGTSMAGNPYGDALFGQLFFTITGFHGLHVFVGVVLLTITYLQIQAGVFELRGHYEHVEKVGLYWHFVDLVWIFVFTLFYLI